MLKGICDGATHLPVHTSIRDGHTVLQILPGLSITALLSGLQVRLDHNTRDTHLPLLELLTDIRNDLGLVHMVLHRVSVRAVDHDRRVRIVRTLLSHIGEGSLDVFLGVVGAVGTASENNVHVLVAVGLDDGGHSLVVDTHEAVRVFGGAHGVDSNRHRAVRSVLETYETKSW